MMKIKVSKKFENEMKEWLGGGNNRLLLLQQHVDYQIRNVKWHGFQTFNDFNSFEMAMILSEGYEVEMTADEKALDFYDKLEPEGKTVIDLFLNFAEIDFKGITDDESKN